MQHFVWAREQSYSRCCVLCVEKTSDSLVAAIALLVDLLQPCRRGRSSHVARSGGRNDAT
jgi:hypothetical protein